MGTKPQGNKSGRGENVTGLDQGGGRAGEEEWLERGFFRRSVGFADGLRVRGQDGLRIIPRFGETVVGRVSCTGVLMPNF